MCRHGSLFSTFAAMLALILSVVSPGVAQAPNSPVGGHLVGTVLGTPSTGAIGDYQTKADLWSISDFAFLPNGDMLVVDSDLARVFRVGPDGHLRTYAGNGLFEHSGDGGAATDAGLHSPSRIAADALGNVYLTTLTQASSQTDSFGGRLIRKISQSGQISTIAGNGQRGCPADGAHAADSPLSHVGALAADKDGWLYFSISDCGRIYRLRDDGIVHVYAGGDFENTQYILDHGTLPSSKVYFSAISDLSLAPNGDLIAVISTQYWPYALRITPSGLTILIAGPKSGNQDAGRVGNATSITFRNLVSAAPLANGRVLLAQNGVNASASLRQEFGVIDASGNYDIIFTGDMWGGKPGTVYEGRQVAPELLRVHPSGDVYFRDRNRGAIFRTSLTGGITHVAGRLMETSPLITTGEQPTFRAGIVGLSGSDHQGNLYFASMGKLYRLSLDGALDHIAGNGANAPVSNTLPPKESALLFEDHVEVDGAGNIYWASNSRTVIRKLSPDGSYRTVWGRYENTTPTWGNLSELVATSVRCEFIHWGVSADGTIYVWSKLPSPSNVVDSEHVWKVGGDGIIHRYAGAIGVGTSGPGAVPALDMRLYPVNRMRVSSDGAIFFQEQNGSVVLKIDTDGMMRSFNQGSTFNLQDGTPTSETGIPFLSTFVPLASDRLLVSGGAIKRLAHLKSGGTVSVWRDQYGGRANGDGGYLRDDRFRDTRDLVLLPDGGLLWKEGNTFRRSFPVPVGCTYTVTPSQATFGSDSSTTQVIVTTGANCPWTVGSSSNWVSIEGKRFGKGTATITLHIEASQAGMERQATVLVAGKEVALRQAANPAISHLSLSPGTANVAPEGGNVQFRITATSGLNWSASITGEGATITGPTQGSGDGSVTVAVTALPDNLQERSASLSINGQTATIIQKRAVANTVCTIQASRVGVSAIIDGVSRPLPYAGNWAVGSTHAVEIPEYVSVKDGHMLRFRTQTVTPNVPDPNNRTVLITTPAGNCGVSVVYDAFYRVDASINLPEPVSPLISLYPEFHGLQFNSEFYSIPTGRNQSHWVPEGGVFRLFATQDHNWQFSHFSGVSTPQQNPITLTVNEPLALTVVYRRPDYDQNSGIGGGILLSWRLHPESSNAAKYTRPIFATSGLTHNTFVSYNLPVGSTPWLTTTSSNQTGAFTLEASLEMDAVKANIGSQSGRLQSKIHLYNPGALSTTLDSEVIVDPMPAGPGPHLDAVADAGGYMSAVPPFQRLTVARGMIITLFGRDLASQTATATSVPLPTQLVGTVVEIHHGGDATPLPLFYVSPGQINAQIPESIDNFFNGAWRIRVTTANGVTSDEALITLAARATSMFAADASGSGAPAGFFVRVLPDQSQQRGSLANCDQSGCQPVPIPGGANGEQLFLELYGTGFRNNGLPENMRAFIGGKEAEIVYASAHQTFVGLDQLNIKVPVDTPRGVPLDVYLWTFDNYTSSWASSNRLTVRFE